MSISYRKIYHADLEQIAALEKSLFSTDAYSVKILESLVKKNSYICVLAYSDALIIGYIIVGLDGVEDSAEIFRIAVVPSFQRMHIGNSLLVFVLNTVIEKKYERLLLEVRAKNTSAQGLYRYFGFEVIGRRKAYYNSPIEDAIIFEKII